MPTSRDIPARGTDYLGAVCRPCLFDLFAAAAEGSFILLGLLLLSSRMMRRRGRSHVVVAAVFFRGDDYVVPRGLHGIEDGEQGDVVHALLLETNHQHHGFMANVAAWLIESEIENTIKCKRCTYL